MSSSKQPMNIGGFFPFSTETEVAQYGKAIDLALANTDLSFHFDIFSQSGLNYLHLLIKKWDIIITSLDTWRVLMDYTFPRFKVFAFQPLEDPVIETVIRVFALGNISSITLLEDTDSTDFVQNFATQCTNNNIEIVERTNEKTSFSESMEFQLGMGKYVVVPSFEIEFIQSVLFRLAMDIEKNFTNETPILILLTECEDIFIPTELCPESGCLEFIKKFSEDVICMDTSTAVLNSDWMKNIWAPETKKGALSESEIASAGGVDDWSGLNMAFGVPAVYDAVTWSIESLNELCPEILSQCTDEIFANRMEVLNNYPYEGIILSNSPDYEPAVTFHRFDSENGEFISIGSSTNYTLPELDISSLLCGSTDCELPEDYWMVDVPTSLVAILLIFVALISFGWTYLRILKNKLKYRLGILNHCDCLATCTICILICVIDLLFMTELFGFNTSSLSCLSRSVIIPSLRVSLMLFIGLSFSQFSGILLNQQFRMYNRIKPKTKFLVCVGVFVILVSFCIGVDIWDNDDSVYDMELGYSKIYRRFHFCANSNGLSNVSKRRDGTFACLEMILIIATYTNIARLISAFRNGSNVGGRIPYIKASNVYLSTYAFVSLLATIANLLTPTCDSNFHCTNPEISDYWIQFGPYWDFTFSMLLVLFVWNELWFDIYSKKRRNTGNNLKVEAPSGRTVEQFQRIKQQMQVFALINPLPESNKTNTKEQSETTKSSDDDDKLELGWTKFFDPTIAGDETVTAGCDPVEFFERQWPSLDVFVKEIVLFDQKLLKELVKELHKTMKTLHRNWRNKNKLLVKLTTDLKEKLEQHEVLIVKSCRLYKKTNRTSVVEQKVTPFIPTTSIETISKQKSIMNTDLDFEQDRKIENNLRAQRYTVEAGRNDVGEETKKNLPTKHENNVNYKRSKNSVGSVLAFGRHEFTLDDTSHKYMHH
eukprot:TRINITY_DN7092_c0_g1_i1.p1 TRINITY_DN7092_c0_g1~~TRINITY_DN7092_c0_g1_i1.p1  ORF type:complete len:938 (-),score=161.47 TRINITY_DN7092_c0_g1_i1:194-3007(-)